MKVYLIRAKVIIFLLFYLVIDEVKVATVTSSLFIIMTKRLASFTSYRCTTCTYDSLVIMLENNSFQIHNLLELVKKEQNIYNVAFNEIIRQVSDE